VHINPTEGGLRPPKEWQAVLDKMHLIFVSPNKASNNVSMLRRVVLGLDSLATVKAKFKVDPARVYVGGFSGGGHMAMLSGMMYPEIYQGAISHAAQSILPGHFPGLSLFDTKSAPRAKHKWCVISGDKDKNYARVKETSKDWERARFLYKFIDVPGMGHEPAPASAFEEALLWIGAGLPDKDKKKAGGAK
jgi:poly(3-hydroxybutyrate) depolymerase